MVDVTNMTNVSGFFDLGVTLQDASDGILFPAMLLGLFVVLTFMIRGTFLSTIRSMLGASFITLIMAIPLTVMGFLASQYLYLNIFIVALMGALSYAEGKLE